MVGKKGKCKMVYEGGCYYWYAEVADGGHRIHIFSGDKKTHNEEPFFDTEVPVMPKTSVIYMKEFSR